MYLVAGVMFTVLLATTYATEMDVQEGEIQRHEMVASCESTNSSAVDMCCAGRVVPKPSNAECCGAAAYDTHTHLCCSGHISARRDSRECCGASLYNTKWFMCCDGNIVRRAGTNACCGTQGYHTDFNICCDGQVYMKQLFACEEKREQQ